MLSIASVVKGFEAAQKALDQKKVQDMKTLGFGLVAVIPPECYQLADLYRWYGEKTAKEGWKLPEFLENVAAKTADGKCESRPVFPSTLARIGCTNFDELKHKFRALEKAWAGVIRIEFDDRFLENARPYLLIDFFAVGLEPNKVSKAAQLFS